MKGIRTRNKFDPGSSEPFKLSRTKLELFIRCRRCFYLDRRLGVSQPSGPPFSLNSAVDALLKKEFDRYRELQQPHPLMTENGIDAVPFRHECLELWRESLRGGIAYHHSDTNLIITGGVDDIWIRPNGELIVVDYKATAKAGEVSLDAEWQISYKRQMEIYQWLFRKNNFKVSDEGYFVYCNGNLGAADFGAKLCFTIKMIPYSGKTDWIDLLVPELLAVLRSDTIPEAALECEFCVYRLAANSFENHIGSKDSS